MLVISVPACADTRIDRFANMGFLTSSVVTCTQPAGWKAEEGCAHEFSPPRNIPPPLSCGQFELAPSAHILQICDPIAISYCGLVRRCDGRSGVVLYLHLYQDSVGHSEVSICHNDYKTSNPWGTGPGGLKCLSLYQRKDTVSF